MVQIGKKGSFLYVLSVVAWVRLAKLERVLFIWRIARSKVQKEPGDYFLNQHLIRDWIKKDRIKISQFTKFEVLPLDCNYVEGFQKSGKIRDFVWI